MPDEIVEQIPLFHGVELPAIRNSPIGMPDAEEITTFECPHCGNETENEDAIRLNGEPHCGDCVRTCERCDGTILSDDAVNARTSGYSRNDTGTFCEDCTFECADCQTRYSEDAESGENSNGERVCVRCSESYTTCENCNATICNDDAYYDEDSEEHVCRSCHRERQRDRRKTVLHDYSYKPSVELFKLPAETTKLHIGIELEVDHKEYRNREQDIGKSALAGSDLFYCKHDGSLENGFEIVSHPATFAYWGQAKMPWLNELQMLGYRSYATTTCGFHIHVSRDALTKLDQLKLLEFFKVNRHFIRKASRRKEENLTRWARVEDGPAEKLVRKVKDGPEERYEAINLMNRHTVEFRIFRGTLSEKGLRRNIALIYSLCMFVKCHWVREMTRVKYLEWLASDDGRAIVGSGVDDLINWVTRL